MTILENDGDCLFTFDDNIQFKFICRIDENAYQALFAQELSKREVVIPKDILKNYYGESWIEKYKDLMYSLRELEEVARKRITPEAWDDMFYTFLIFLIFREKFMDLKEVPIIGIAAPLDPKTTGEYLRFNSKTMSEAIKNITEA